MISKHSFHWGWRQHLKPFACPEIPRPISIGFFQVLPKRPSLCTKRMRSSLTIIGCRRLVWINRMHFMWETFRRSKSRGTRESSLKLLEENGTSITVYHVGRDELSLLSDAMLAAGLQRPVRSIGTLSDDALASAYAGAVCSIVTSTHEGFCLPVLEAQNLRIPVITSDIPILREVAGEGALYF